MQNVFSKNALKYLSFFIPVAFLFFLLFSGCISNRLTKQTDPLFVNDPKLVTETLSNGFSYILMKNKKPADRVSMHLVVKSGSMNETDEQQGLAHYLEHMLFNGSDHFPPGELVKFFQSIGMNFGGDANAHTGFYETIYDIVLPKGDAENLSKGLLVMRDYAGGALLLSSEIEREKNIILAEKRDRDSASYRMFKSTLNFELEGMKIPYRLPIGTTEIIKSANRKLLKDYYDAWYRPSRMTLVMAGDFDAEKIRRMIKEKFSDLKARAPEAKEYEPGEVSHTGIKTFYHFEKEIGKTSISIETVDDTPWKKDSLEKRKQDLILTLANNMLQYRLDVLTSRPDAPFTSASASSGVFLRNVRYSDISADCSPEKWEESLTVIEQSLRAAIQYGFHEDEFNRARENYITTLKRRVKEAETRDSTKLAKLLTRSVIDETIFLSPANGLKLFEPFLLSLKSEDVNSAFQKAWDADHRLIIVTGNIDLTKQSAKPEKKIDRVYQASLTVPVRKPEKEKEVSFPYLPKPDKKGKILRKITNSDLDITMIEFENGVRLNLKKTDFKDNEVLYKVIFGGGKKNEPADKPGLASLSTSLINESGFGTLNNEELKRALTGKSTSLMFNIANDHFTISGKSVTEESELMMQLIRTQLLDPGFRKDIYSLIMERMKQNYQKMENTIEGADSLHGKKFLAGNDNRFGFPSFDEYASNTIEDVKKWAGGAIRSENIEISLTGDFQVESIIDACALYLGSLPDNRNSVLKNKAERKSPEFPSGKKITLPVKTKVPKCLVKVAFKTDDFWDIGRTRRLSALGAVFSDRLRNTIREELGAAYSPYAFNRSSSAFKGYGVFQAVISVKPGQQDIVEKKVKEIAEQLSSEKISKEELERAIDPILTHIKDLKETNNYWLNSVLSGVSRYPEKLDWAKTIASDYASITPEDILFYAKKYMRKGSAATVTITAIE